MKETLHIDHLPGRILFTEGKEYLYCSGTSYLGMAKNETFSAYLQEGMARYGTNYSSSRISNLQLQIFEEAEAYVADFTGALGVLISCKEKALEARTPPSERISMGIN